MVMRHRVKEKKNISNVIKTALENVLVPVENLSRAMCLPVTVKPFSLSHWR